MLEFRGISHINHIIHKTEPSFCPTKGLNHNSRPGQSAFQPNCRAVGMPPLAIGPQAEAAQSGRQNGARRARQLASMARISIQRQGGTTASRLQKQLACCHAQALQLPDMHAAYTSATILKKAPGTAGQRRPHVACLQCKAATSCRRRPCKACCQTHSLRPASTDAHEKAGPVA